MKLGASLKRANSANQAHVNSPIDLNAKALVIACVACPQFHGRPLQISPPPRETEGLPRMLRCGPRI